MDPTFQLEEAQIQGKILKVIDDAQLLDWAARERLSPRKAQVMALGREIIPARYLKNFEAMSLGEQIRLCEGSALVCGCGGLGGTIIQLLARAGVGCLRLVDPDVFAPSNLNRQWMSDTKALGQSKAETAAERARTINPFVDVESHPVRLDEDNAFELLAGMDIAVDALDNLAARFALEEGARRRSIPFLHGAVAGWWGQISTFMPRSAYSLETIYGLRRQRDPAEEAMGVPGPTAAVIGSLQAMEAMRILAGKEPAWADRLLYFDGETGTTSLLPF
ncbi:MAG: HesA/MoeB/ThiF family protein [Syntrophobacteraceae bacterium]|jgi:molybdopterin/thiamine biosynthesis adenylyltransferase|nr:HesA/MoeB/ThiF family protein [Syntrophobacteraceae bacterium]